jgi:chorismate mutase / prephenate dehydratase
MPPRETPLDDLRREIDEIDAALHDLIMRRTAVVERVAQAKRADRSAMRPAREAAILRALAERHTGPFPLVALARIWREMISALTRLQGPFAVAVHAPGDNRHYWDMARDHFGSNTPMLAVNSPVAAFRALAEGSCTIGIVPWPEEDDAEPWWRYLFSEDPKTPRIIARLPFVSRSGPRNEEPEALALAAMPLEPTGNDHTFIGIELRSDVSRGRLKDYLEQAGLIPGMFRTHFLPGGGGTVHLVLVEEFVDAADPRLTTLSQRLGDSLYRLMPLGAYAAPIPAPGTPESRRG